MYSTNDSDQLEPAATFSLGMFCSDRIPITYWLALGGDGRFLFTTRDAKGYCCTSPWVIALFSIRLYFEAPLWHTAAIKMKFYAKLLVLLLSASSSTAFIINSGLQELMSRAFRANPDLKTFSDAFPGHVLDVRLDIGKSDTIPATHKRMAIQDLVLGLESSNKGDISKTIPMLGANGPHPGTSGGIGKLQVIKSGHFIDLTGTVKMDFAPAANWELVWRQDSPMGSLNCGLDLKNDATRNSATLHKGLIYLSFYVWNTATLREYQERKLYVNDKAAEHLQDRDDELAKMTTASNVFAKAMHYRNAAAAVEKYSLQPVRSMSQVPGDDEVIQIDDDLFLTRKGTVWTKDHGVFGIMTFLGEAVIQKSTIPNETLVQTASWSADSIAP